MIEFIIPRPEEFKFKAGDYVYVNFPDICKSQWYSITITSAPENQGYFFIWLNISKFQLF